jgi:hypothetical protein
MDAQLKQDFTPHPFLKLFGELPDAEGKEIINLVRSPFKDQPKDLQDTLLQGLIFGGGASYVRKNDGKRRAPKSGVLKAGSHSEQHPVVEGLWPDMELPAFENLIHSIKVSAGIIGP